MPHLGGMERKGTDTNEGCWPASDGLCVWEYERCPQQCVKTLAGVPRMSFDWNWVVQKSSLMTAGGLVDNPDGG